MGDVELGAYGLRIDGLSEAARWMRRVAREAPALYVELRHGTPHPAQARVDQDSVDIGLQGLADARLQIERATGRVTYVFGGAVPPAADVLHPYLAPAAAAAHAWEGREALHAGAFRSPAGAVVLLGGKEAGKSSMLAWLGAELGQDVIADDLCVLRGGAVLPGPRCVDLREPTTLRYGPRWNGQVVRSRERIRLSLPAGSGEPAEVAGTVVLGWSDRLRIEPVAPAERLHLIAAQRYFSSLQADPRAILDLLSRPVIRLLRPRDLGLLPATAEALLGHWSF